MRYLLILVCALVTTFPSVGFAQSETDARQAKEHYDRGAALYFEGEYSQAILEFMRAHDILPEPVFLYNIALSHWRLGNLDKAIDAAEETLRSERLDPEIRASVQARAVAFRRLRRIEAVDWTLREPGEVEGPDVVEPAVVERDRFPRPIGWVGISMTVAGGGFLAGFAIMETTLHRKVDSYKEAAAAGDAQRYDELKEEIDSGQPISLGLLAGGIGLATVGGVLIVWDLSRGGGSEAPQVTWSPPAAVRFVW